MLVLPITSSGALFDSSTVKPVSILSRGDLLEFFRALSSASVAVGSENSIGTATGTAVEEVNVVIFLTGRGRRSRRGREAAKKTSHTARDATTEVYGRDGVTI